MVQLSVLKYNRNIEICERVLRENTPVRRIAKDFDLTATRVAQICGKMLRTIARHPTLKIEEPPCSISSGLVLVREHRDYWIRQLELYKQDPCTLALIQSYTDNIYKGHHMKLLDQKDIDVSKLQLIVKKDSQELYMLGDEYVLYLRGTKTIDASFKEVLVDVAYSLEDSEYVMWLKQNAPILWFKQTELATVKEESEAPSPPLQIRLPNYLNMALRRVCVEEKIALNKKINTIVLEWFINNNS
jgi:hypothetical protein